MKKRTWWYLACYVFLLLAVFFSGVIQDVCVWAMQPQRENPVREESLIKEAVENLYIKGLETRNFDLIEAVCIPEARTMSAERDGALHVTTLEKWSKRFDPQNPPFKELEYTIVGIDREGTAAQVKILFVVDSKRHVTDFLQMLKLDGKWRIVNIINT
jgi:hypothetical protein